MDKQSAKAMGVPQTRPFHAQAIRCELLRRDCRRMKEMFIPAQITMASAVPKTV
jgi:hypothetical protein